RRRRERRRVRQSSEHQFGGARRRGEHRVSPGRQRRLPLDGFPRCLRHHPDALARHVAGDRAEQRPRARRWLPGVLLDGCELQPRIPAVADYYFADPSLALVPIEHLTPIGMSGEFAALLAARRGWRSAQIALFDAGFSLYWTRSAALAGRTATWPAPRLRHVAVVADGAAVRPYSQLLNTSAWLLYASDLDADRSHPEYVAYLLAHGDRMAVSGEVTTAAVQAAAWWLERSDEECAAFAAAAARATRCDAAGYQAIAAALPWLRRLRHADLCPPLVVSPHRAVPGTGLLVPRALEQEPPALVVRWREAAERALGTYRA